VGHLGDLTVDNSSGNLYIKQNNTGSSTGWSLVVTDKNLASTTGIIPIAKGGTGTSTLPTLGQLLMGNASGGYNLVSTSSLGISAGSGYASGTVNNGLAGQIPFYSANGNTLTATSAIFISTVNGNVGIGSSTPSSLLTVSGNGWFGGNITSTGTIYANALSVASLSGLLRATNGLISTSTINLASASDVSGTLPIANGGTGTSTAPTFGKLLMGNASGGYNLVSTSSLGISAGGSSQWTTSGSNIYYNTGNVGIGTTSNASALNILGDQTITGNLSLNKYTTAAGRSVIVGSRFRGTNDSPLAVVNGDQAFSLLGAGFDGTNGIIAASMEFVVDGTVSTGNVPMKIGFYTGPTGGRTEKMTISSGGNVGIGTALPTMPLDVVGTIRSQGASGSSAKIYASGLGDASNYSFLSLSNALSGANNREWQITNRADGVANRLAMFFFNGSGWSEPLTILPTGNVGIGNSNPSSKLQVGGTVTATAFVGDGSGLTNLPSTSQWTSNGLNLSYDNGYVSMGVTTPMARLHVAPMASGYFTGFETGSISPLTSGGNGGWYVTSADKYQGSYSAKAVCNAANNGDFYSNMYLTYNIVKDSKLSFYYKIDANSANLFLQGNVGQQGISNSLDSSSVWYYKEFNIPIGGVHTFEFIASVFTSSCTVLIDNINITLPNGQIVPAAIFDGAVGINTTAPTVMLDVNGTAKATAFVGDGSGLTNLPAGSQWTTTGSNIYYNSGNIGMGTSSPATALEVQKTAASILRVSNTNSPSVYYGELYSNYDGNNSYGLRWGSGNTNLIRYISAGAKVFVGASDALSIVSGKVGIGTSTPEGSLTVSAPAQASTREKILTVRTSDGGNSVLGLVNGTSLDGAYYPSIGSYQDSSNGRESLSFKGYISPANDASDSAASGVLEFMAGRVDTPSDPFNGVTYTIVNRKLFTFRNDTTVMMTITANGNIGIGTTTPASKLSVVGDIALTGGIVDSSTSKGISGMVLQTTGTGVQWVATSTLGFAGTVGGSSQWNTLGSDINYTAGSVGIGTTSSVRDLTVDGTGIITGNMQAGTLTVGLGSGTGGSIQMKGVGSTTKAFTFGNGDWYTSGVPYVRPNDTNTSGVFDVLSNGTGVDSWIDIGSDYTAQNPNGEFLSLRKLSSSYGQINVKGLGTGVGRDLVFQDLSSGVAANGGTSRIGFNTAPTEQYHAKFDQNNKTTFVVENASTGTAAYTTIEARNSTTTNDYIRMITLGNNWTTNGAFIQDSGALETGVNLSGGLSLLTRNASAPIMFYTGGYATSNERMRITQTGNVGVGTSSPLAKLDIYGTAGTSDIFAISSSSNSRIMTVSANGNVGFGTSSAVSKFTLSYGTGGVAPWYTPDVLFQGPAAGVYLQNTGTGGGFGSLGIGGTSGNMIFSFANNKDVIFQSTDGNTFNTRLAIDGVTGNVGIGTSTPFAKLSVSGDMALTGGLYDSSTTMGTNGMVLQTTGTGVKWVATSTLGFSGGSSQWTTSGSNINYITGKVSVGTTTAEGALTVLSPAQASTREKILTVRTSDGGNSVLGLVNGTILDGAFYPSLGGYVDSSNSRESMGFKGLVSPTNDASDSATMGIMDFFVSRNDAPTDPFNSGSSTDILNRKLFTFRNNLTTIMSLTAAGNVGIGTSTPSTLLFVNNASNAGTSVDNAGVTIKSVNRTAYLSIDSASIGSPSLIFSNAGVEKSRIMYSNPGDWLSFSTAATERMRIDSAGNVGIGTTTPETADGTTLHIYNGQNTGTVTSNASLVLQSLNRNSNFISRISASGASSYMAQSTDALTTYGQYQILANNGNPYLAMAIKSIERLRIDVNGNMGLGTSTPTAKLDVYGTSSQLDLFALSSSSNARLFTVGANGNVGIGTASPASALDIGTGRMTGGTNSASKRNYLDMSVAQGTSAVDMVLNGGDSTVSNAGTGKNVFRTVQLNLVGSTDLMFQVIPLTTTGYGGFETAFGAGSFVGTYGNFPILFRPNRVTQMQLSGAGGLSLGSTYVATDPGAGNMIVQGNIGIGASAPVTQLQVASPYAKTDTTQRWGEFIGSNDSSVPFGLAIGARGASTAANRTMSLQTSEWSGGLWGNLALQPGAGSVGVGTTSPSAKLDVYGSASTTDIFAISSSSNARLFTVNSSGYVGIGTALPLTPLNNTVPFTKTDTTQRWAQFISSNDTSVPFGLAIGVKGAATASNRTVTLQTSEWGGGYWGNIAMQTGAGNVGIGTSSPVAKLDIYGSASTTDLFVISSSSNTRLLTVDSNGSLGIGTSTFPSGEKLHIVGSNTLVRFENLEGAVANQYAQIALRAGSSTNYIWTNNQNSAGFYGGSNSLNLFAGASAPMSFFTNGIATPKMNIDTSGNVGIGTTTPVAKLDIYGTAGTADLFALSSSSNARLFTVGSNGNVGIGTTSNASMLNIVGDQSIIGNIALNKYITAAGRSVIQGTRYRGTSDSPLAVAYGDQIFTLLGAGYDGTNVINASAIEFLVDNTVSTGNMPVKIAFNTGPSGSRTEKMTISSGGNVGIGTSTPTALLHVAGTMRNSTYGIGNLVSDSLGNITVSSDERLKNIQGSFNRGLSDLQNINPIIFKWKDSTGYDTENVYAGFSAQNVKLSIPEAVGVDPKGMMTLSDRPILAALVNAVKELNIKYDGTNFTALEDRVNKIEAKVNNVNGFEIKDRATGETYCMFMENGYFRNEKGTCTASKSTSTPATVINNSPVILNNDATNTPSNVSSSTPLDVSSSVSAETPASSTPVIPAPVEVLKVPSVESSNVTAPSTTEPNVTELSVTTPTLQIPSAESTTTIDKSL